METKQMRNLSPEQQERLDSYLAKQRMSIKKNDNDMEWSRLILRRQKTDMEWSRLMLQRQKTMIKIKLLKLMIDIGLIWILFLLFGCATPQYIPSSQIKPVYPQMRECPDLTDYNNRVINCKIAQ